MARQKEFDQEKVLEKAMGLFWEQGYEATSIQNLVDHLGIGRGSLYDTYGGKHDLFLAALDRYQTGIGQAAFAPLKEPESPIAAIKQVFDNLVMEALADPKRCGCFLVNSALELAPHDPAMAARSKAAVEGMITMFHQTLRQAQATEELPPEKDIRALARFLSNGVIGLRVMAKINPQREILQDIAAMTLAVLA